MMRASIRLFVMFIMMNFASMVLPEKASAQVSVSFQVFYDDLSPYGYWVDYPDYGYVWVPGYGPGFVPYSTNGYWAYTEYGWTWISYYSWGWAPFHYGRWAYDSYYGWFWIPDDVWGPAWVCWRTGPGYYGWAPLGPYISYDIVIAGNYNPPANQWIFINGTYMGRNDIYLHYSPRKYNTGYLTKSKIIDHKHVDNKSQITYMTGPRREDVEKVRGTKIKPIVIKDGIKHGQSLHNNELTIYRPEIVKNKDDAKPAKIVDKKNVKSVPEMKTQKKTWVEKKEPAFKREPVKKSESKENIVKPKQQENEVKPKQQETYPKKIKQAQQPKMIEPKKNEYKNPPSQPQREMKKQEAPRRMVQPNMNQNKNPGFQPQQNQGNPHKRPR